MTAQSEAGHLLSSVHEGVAVLTLNRPEKLNAFTSGMYAQVIEVLDDLDERDDVRVVVVTGSGRGFCSGADLSRGPSTFDSTGRAEVAEYRDPGGLVSLRVRRLRKPIIAAINGPAVGFGASFVLPMDLRIAAKSATFRFPYVNRGIVPEGAASSFLPRIVGIGRALDWTLTARVVEADEALAAGLVHSVHRDEDVLAAGIDLARTIAEAAAPVSAAATRHLLWRSLEDPDPLGAHRRESALLWHLGSSADAAEGVSAFWDKRIPRWTMSPASDLPIELL